jgi:hypothetical protein
MNTVATQEWARVDAALPESGKPVLAHYVNRCGKSRVVRAIYAARLTLPASETWDECEYSEDDDEFYCPEGWYEFNEQDETHWRLESPATHWMPLPLPPEVAP